MQQNKYWILVVVAGLFEVVWVSGLKYSSTPLQWVGTVIAIILSFYLFILTTYKLPTSTAYSVFVGLGAAGTVIVEMVVFNEPVHWGKIALLVTLLAGVIGLKLAETGSDDRSQQQQSKHAMKEDTK